MLDQTHRAPTQTLGLNLLINLTGVTQQVERGGFLHNKRGWWWCGGEGGGGRGGDSVALLLKRELKYMYLSGSCNKNETGEEMQAGEQI